MNFKIISDGSYKIFNLLRFVNVSGTEFAAAGYGAWGPGEPGNNACGAIMRNGKVDDVQCGNRLAFICEGNLNE